jgi:hypothetical protein
MPTMAAADRPSDAALVAGVGATMFGEEWAAPLARWLGVNVRTMQRLKAAVSEGGGYPLNPDLLAHMADLLRERARVHLEDAKRLEAAAREAEGR